MIPDRSILVVSSLLALASFGRAEVDVSKLPPASSRKGLTYAKDIKPLFEASCLGCHGEERQKGDLRLDSLEAVLKGGEDGKIVVVGKGAQSSLVAAISQLDEETAMPPKRKGGRGGPGGPPPGGRPPGPGGPGGPGPGGPGGPPKALTAEQVGLVRAWIDQGAK